MAGVVLRGFEKNFSFTDLADSYSPCFLVKGEGGAASYSFLDDEEKVVSLGENTAPAWVGEGGFVSVTSTKEIDEDGKEIYQRRMAFHYKDGTEVPLEGKRNFFSFDGTDFFYESSDGSLLKYYKETGKTEDFGEYKHLYRDRYVSRAITIMSASTSSEITPYLYRIDHRSRTIFIRKIQNGQISEERPFVISSGDTTYITCFRVLNTSNKALITTGNGHAFVFDLEEGGVEEVPVAFRSYCCVDFTYFEYTLYSGKRYDLIERHWPSSSALLYALDKKTNQRVLVQRGSSKLFNFQRIEEVE